MSTYSTELYDLQVELCRFQAWVRDTGQRVIVIFEGRDTAGKGGMIRTIQERVSHRVFRSVALPKPSNKESTQWYPQRYIEQFPSAGEVILFDRSWYNRAGVERVMGFCTEEEARHFLKETPGFEEALVENGIYLVKYFLEISKEVQLKRLMARGNDPRKYWKLSPMDLQAQTRWYDYSRARDAMLEATDSVHAPWYIVPSDNQKQARLACIRHFLSLFPYEGTEISPPDITEAPGPDLSAAYDDTSSLAGRKIIPFAD